MKIALVRTYVKRQHREVKQGTNKKLGKEVILDAKI